MRLRSIVLAAGSALLLTRGAQARTVALAPSEDNTMFASALPETLSSGAGTHLFVGTNAGGQPRRALVRFDLSPYIHAGSTVTSATLTVHMSRTLSFSGVREVALHLVQASWGEGTSNSDGAGGGGGGAGAPATLGDATWYHRFFGGARWTTPGGDFAGGASATTLVDTVIGSYTWSTTSQMVADIQGWVNNPSTNFGWVLVTNETALGSSKRYDSREHANAAFRPRLAITFTPAATDVAERPVAASLRLDPACPNPFNPSTTIAYSLPAAARVRLTLHDARGRYVATLVDREQPAGRHAMVWDGRDTHGFPTASGVYVVRLETSGAMRSQHVVLTR